MGPTGKTLIILAALVVIAAAIKTAEDLMVPFLLAAFISTIAATPVFWLERRRVPTSIAIALVMIGFIVMIIGLGAVVAQSVGAFTARLPFYEERLAQTLQDLIALAAPLGIELSTDTLQSYFDPGTALVMAGNTLSGLGGALSNGFLI